MRAVAERAPVRAGGISFAPSDEQALLVGEIRRFAEERIMPGTRERDRAHEFPADLVREMGELGLLGMIVPEAYGGAGLDSLSYLLAMEEIARACPSLAVTMSVTNSVCCWPIAQFGGESVKRTILKELASGRSIGGFGLTEPGSGSDAAAMRTTARRDGNAYVLDGEKAWITNAGVGNHFVVLAKTDPLAGKRGITAFVVPADAPGFRVGAAEEKLGLRASRTAQLFFEGCRIPVDHRLGEEGEGFKIALRTLDHSRLGIAAQAVGIHRRALELAVAYARDRVQFGRPIAEHQAVAFSLAKMATELAAARCLTHAAALREGASDGGRWAAQAKAYASEAANRACYDALQIHGGNGFSEEYEIARLYRDVRVTTIYEGTSEMQRLVVARHLLGS
jgi:alkylation response protein AidB-like acyl-CoA dehydrogenase